MAKIDGFNDKLLGMFNNPETTPVKGEKGGVSDFTLTQREYKTLMNDYTKLSMKDRDRLMTFWDGSGVNVTLFEAFEDGLPYSNFLDLLGVKES